MPNIIAYTMLLIWPIVMIVLFKKLSVSRAMIWSILGAHMLLPPGIGFDLPIVPTLTKDTIPSIVGVGICLVLLKTRHLFLPESTLARVLLVFFVVSPVATVLTNSDAVFLPRNVLPGLRLYDAAAMFSLQFFSILPLFLGRALLRDPQALRDFVLALALGGLAYSLPMLLEVRLSPQLNTWIYGYFPHGFDQQIRFGGFRPVVFLGHGLLVAFFTLTTLMAAVTLWRGLEGDKRGLFFFASVYLSVMLVLCKSVGVIVYGVLIVPLMIAMRSMMQIRVALILGLLVFFYPILRGADLVPVDQMLELAAKVQEERAASLGTRLENEARLLEHASQKPVFGWGGYGRNELYDPETGRNITITDGHWIITIGIYGWTGFIAVFGLLTLPLVHLWRQARRSPDTVSPLAGGAALILAVAMVDLLPNASINPMTWLLAGMLLGYAEALKTGPAQTEDARVIGKVPARDVQVFARDHGAGLPGRPEPPPPSEGRTSHPRYSRS